MLEDSAYVYFANIMAVTENEKKDQQGKAMFTSCCVTQPRNISRELNTNKKE
jgi:hypothetical protein